MFSRFIRYQTYISFYSCYFPCHAYIIIISEIEKLFSSIGMGYQSITPKTTIFCPTCEPKNSSNSLNKQSRFSVPRNDFLDPNSSFETLIYPWYVLHFRVLIRYLSHNMAPLCVFQTVKRHLR